MSKPAAYAAALALTVSFLVFIYFVWKHQLDTSLAPPRISRPAGQPLP